MRRGVPGGLRMAPAEAHDPAGLLPRRFADVPNTYPRPRIPCSDCGEDLVLCFGEKRRHYMRHVGKRSGKVNCTKGQYQELNEQIVDSYRIAFELPKRESMILGMNLLDV